MTTSELSSKYNNASTGLFKTGQNRGIGSDDMRSMITDMISTFNDVFMLSNYVPGTTGTNTYVGSTPISLLSYTAGMKILVKFSNGSTGASTLNLSAVGAKKIFINPTTQAGSADILQNQVYLLSYEIDLDSAVGGWLMVGSGGSGGGSFTLTDGEGTTAAGTSVNFGGAVTGASIVDIGIAGAVVLQANAIGTLSLGIGSSSIILDTGDTSLVFADDMSVTFADDRATPLGIQYAADYTTLTNLSLVHKKFVTDNFLQLSGGTLTGNLTLSGLPTNALHAATKSYVDNLITGLTWKNEVACATTANITISGEQTIDGVTTSASRVLVKNQSTASQNGLYLSAAGAWTRVLDADTGTELAGATVYVGEGTLNGNTQWSCSNVTITLGVTSVTFVQIAGAGVYTAGTGLTLTGNVFSISASYAGQTSITTLGTIATGVWQGTAIDAAHGGTGQTVYVVGDILSASTTTALSKVAAVAAGSYLRSAGVGTLPVWSAVTLPNSATIGDLIYTSASNVYSNLADVAIGNALISGGVATAPSWGKITSAHVDSTVLTNITGWLVTGTTTLAGNATINGAFKLTYTNSVTAAAGTGYGIEENPAVVAAANADVLRGVSINPIFTNGAFTTVTNSAVAIISGLTASSGTTTFNSLRLAPTFNTTSSYSGIGRGFYFVPNIISPTGLTLYSFLCTDGAFSFTNNFPALNTVTGTWISTASGQSHVTFTGTFTTRATVSDVVTGYNFTPSFTAGATNQNIAAVRINPTWSTTNSPNNVGLWITVGTGDTGALPLYIETTAGARLYQFNAAGTLSIGSTGTASIGAQANGSGSATGRGPLFGTTVSSANSVGFMYAQNSTNITDATVNKKWIRSAAFTYNPTSGVNTLSILEMSPTINQTSTATGAITLLDIIPIYTAVLGVLTVFNYTPSATPTGAHYGIIMNAACFNSFNAGTTPSAFVHIGAGTATTAQTKYNSSTILTTAVAGVQEYNGSWYQTKASGLRFGIPGSIFEAFADTGNATTTETDLHTYTTPTSTLAVNGEKIISEYGGVFVSSGTATRQIKIYFGGTAIFDTGTLTLSLSSAWTAFVTIIRVSSTVVRYLVSFATQGAALSAYTSAGELTGLTLSNTNIIKITGQAAGVGAATNDIVLKLAVGGWTPASAN